MSVSNFSALIIKPRYTEERERGREGGRENGRKERRNHLGIPVAKSKLSGIVLGFCVELENYQLGNRKALRLKDNLRQELVLKNSSLLP